MPRCVRQSAWLHCGPHRWQLGGRPLLMGIVNVTPDSFSDGGAFLDPGAAIAHGLRLLAEGADWLDIGGESTRPGAEPVPADEELRRVLPVVAGLAKATAAPLSIDTFKPEVARAALDAGATIVNDITGFRDPAMVRLAAATDAALVAMHMKGTPQTMRGLAEYDDVLAEVETYFRQRLALLTEAGVAPERVVLDPGIGFAKRRPHNLELLRNLDRFLAFGRPLLLGASRKSIVGELTGQPEAARLSGTVATTIAGYLRGVSVFRVHDVAAMRDALAVAAAIEDG